MMANYPESHLGGVNLDYGVGSYMPLLGCRKCAYLPDGHTHRAAYSVHDICDDGPTYYLLTRHASDSPVPGMATCAECGTQRRYGREYGAMGAGA